MRNHPFSVSGMVCRNSIPLLHGQTFTAFGAASSQHGTAAACFGANQETMGAFAADNGGLISAFHDVSRGNNLKSESGVLHLILLKLSNYSCCMPLFLPPWFTS